MPIEVLMPELESFGSIPRALAGVVLLLAAAYGAGGLIVGSRAASRRRHFSTRLLRFVAGVNVVGLLGIVLGSLHLLAGTRSIWLLVALSLLALPEGRGCLLRHVRQPQLRSGLPRRRLSQFTLIVPVLIVAVITLAPALCPPSGWDELVYHEVLPERWQASGGPEVYLDLPFSGFPSMGEVLFWLAAPIENVILPRLLNWICWTFGLACLYHLLRRYLAATSAVVLTLVVPLNETMLLIVENCYVETIVMMNVAATLLAARTLRHESATGDRGCPIVLGVLAGGAAAVKLTGCAAVVVPCIWYLAGAWCNRYHRAAICRDLALCLTTALIVAFPFYLRPWLATGNPFYPYLCQWFTTDPATLEMSRHHHLIGGFAFGVRSVAAFIDGPLLLAFRTDNYDGRFGFQLVVFVGLAIAAILSAYRHRRLRWAVLWPAAVATWFYIFWFVTAQQARFAVPALLAFVILAGLGLRQLRGPLRRLALTALTVSALASVPWGRNDYYRYSALAVTGNISRINYVHNLTDGIYLPLVQAIDALTPGDAKLMLLYEHRGFYIPRPYVIGTPLFQQGPFTPPEQYANPDRILAVLRHEQITYLVMPKVSIGPDQTDEWFDRQNPFVSGIDACLQQGSLQPVWESEIYLLLKVQPETEGG